MCADGSATISAAVASIKSSPTLMIPSLSRVTVPMPREDTPNLPPDSRRPLAIFPIGVSVSLALPMKLDPSCSKLTIICEIRSRLMPGPSG